ncbi:MAG: transglutaminaseTgpA domain-containing protein [Candidatus Thiodiazotropha sp.]
MKPASIKVSLWYSLVSGVAASAIVYAHLGWLAAGLGFLVTVPVSYWILLRVRRTDEASSPYAKSSEQVAAAGLILFLPLIFLTSLLSGLLVFLGFGFLSLLLQTHDNRRLYLGLGVGFTALMAGAVVAKSGYYLVFLMAYAVNISITLGYVYLEPLSEPSQPWRSRDQLRSVFWLIAIAVVIYLIVPRFPAGNLGARPGSNHFYQNRSWEQEAKQTQGMGDAEERSQSLLEKLAEQMPDSKKPTSQSATDSDNTAYRYRGFEQSFDMDNPDDSGDRFSNIILARMRADRPLYLRARIFDTFDGLRWHSSATTLNKLKLERGTLDLHRVPPGSEAFIEHYEITLEQNLTNNIMAAAIPVKLQFPGTVIGIDAFRQLQAPDLLRKGTAYAVDSLRLHHQGRSLAERTYTDLPGYRQLPDDLDPRIPELARRITRGLTTPFDRALALEAHLRSHYNYDFESIFTSQHQTPLSRFLFETRRGHCEYFASALAILLRTLDIPSRLVTGFSATDLNPLTGYYEIHALDGHAWVEAYIEGLGWLELEPTAYYDMPSQSRQTLSAEQINQYVERQLRLGETVNADRFNLDALMGSLWQLLYLAAVWTGAHLKLALVYAWPWLTGLMVIALIARLSGSWLGPRWRARGIRKEIYRRVDKSDRYVINDYMEGIDRLLRNAGQQIAHGATIEQYLQQFPDLGIRFDPEELALSFNTTNYGTGSCEQVSEKYRRLFDAIYELGYGELSRRTQQPK